MEKKIKFLRKRSLRWHYWKSTNTSLNKLPNNAPLCQWGPILKIPDITFINLQYMDFENEINIIEDKLGVKIHNFDDLDHYNNIDDVAALCASLDSVISNQKMTVPIISGGATQLKLLIIVKVLGNNILLNPINSSVDIFEKNIWEPWDDIFNLIAEDIFMPKNKIKNKKL